MKDSVNSFIYVIFLLILFLVFMVKEHKELTGKDKRIIYFFLPLLKLEYVGGICNLVFSGMLVYTLVTTYHEVAYYHIISFIIVWGVGLCALNWGMYIACVIGRSVFDYLVNVNDKAWFLAFTTPLALIYFEKSVEWSNYPLLYIAYNIEVLATTFCCWVSVYKIMRNIVMNRNCIFLHSSNKEININSDKILAIISLLMIQIANFTSIIYIVNNRYPGALVREKENVTDILDIIYYVIMTYTTVGYGDILPNNTYMKIIACIISMTGFFTSVCLIGEVLKEFTENKITADNVNTCS